jgi:hypothetical protein
MVCIDRRRTAAIAQERDSDNSREPRPADVYHADSGYKDASTTPRNRGWRHRAEVRYVCSHCFLRDMHLAENGGPRIRLCMVGGSRGTMQGELEVTSKHIVFLLSRFD